MSILIDKNTKVITQGITGKTGQFHTHACAAYANGKNSFVAGVTVCMAPSTLTSVASISGTRPIGRITLATRFSGSLT